MANMEKEIIKETYLIIKARVRALEGEIAFLRGMMQKLDGQKFSRDYGQLETLTQNN